MIGTVVRYFGFQVMDNGEALKIEYGLLTKKRYTIQKKKISGFSYHQSFLMKRLKTGTLQLYAIGYGGGSDEESREDPILFPLIKEERLRKAMKEILSQMKNTAESFGYLRCCSLFSALWGECFAAGIRLSMETNRIFPCPLAVSKRLRSL